MLASTKAAIIKTAATPDSHPDCRAPLSQIVALYKPKEASADSGYLSEPNLQALADREISAYIATGRAKHPADGKRKIKEPLTQAMRDKLKRAGWRSRYRLRKQIVEPVFGQIKQARGFRQFLLRGIEKVSAEWAIICTAHNLTKLASAA